MFETTSSLWLIQILYQDIMLQKDISCSFNMKDKHMFFTQDCRKFLYHIILKYTLG